VRSLRLSPTAYRRITLVALLALGFIIVTGAAVRLTGSGLGCTDWPNCEEGQFVAEGEFHAWVEFGNRLITGLVSIAVILAVLGSFWRVPRRRDLTWLSVGLVAGVLVQIVLGAIVVKTHLVPAAVSAHFLVSMVLVWNAVVLHQRAGRSDAPARLAAPTGLRNLARVLVLLTIAVLFVGTLVTGSGPHSGDPGEVDRLTLDIREIARVHGLLAVSLIVVSLASLFWLYRSRASARARARAALLTAALLAQAGIGYAQYLNGVPALLVALHVLGSVIVWMAVLSFYDGLFEHEPLEADTTSEAADDARCPADRPVVTMG
jgi:cytochrome c oxidase assembly protein subunit 15